ncbi:ExeM/NucH family extracellular endonuclease [Flavobacterium sp. W21_SRS_FM6]|uniref:ExeM/NucH family extracellular endonuclease n=1 Tax=Flavobacterium sp. W21_SRS_FM6 TaxID=3240268 RepID=UPI003F8E4AAD
MKLKYPALLALFMVPVTQATVFINEIHYDNNGTDVGEAIEIVGTAGTDLSGMSLVLYNGNNNSVYGTITLSGVIVDQQEGFGALSFGGPSGGIQNGSPDGVALVDAENNVIQFLSYEGSMTASGGAADGLTSTDIGVAQNAAALGTSIQLVGTGSNASDFTWTEGSVSSFGTINAGQSFGGGGNTGGGDSADTGGTVISGSVCTNCPDLEKFKDLAAFNSTTYYESVQTEIDLNSGPSAIKTALNSIISSEIKSLSYAEVWTALTYTDEDPANTDNVILWYTARSQAKSTNGSGAASSNPDNWNREHSWPNSHGFASQSFEAYNDIHHLRATDISVNSSRSNLDFDNSDSPLAESPSSRIDSNSFEPRDDIKGDVARMMFYLDTRYEGSGSDNTPDLVLVNRVTSSGEPNLGKLCTLIAWNSADPVDASEQRRNDRIYELQGNRNPFIDNPAWVATLYPADSCDSTDGGDTGGGDTGGGDTGGGDTGGGDTGGETPATGTSSLVFINEIHYDDAGADASEGIEIAGPAGTDLSGMSLVPYNGNNGQTYSITDLSGTIPNQQNGFGTVFFAISGLQNGAPDGVALVAADGTTVLQFLSYEGSFAATNGPANGLTSEDIGVNEPGSTLDGFSLQLSGSGFKYSDFAWQDAAPSTYDEVNTGQTFIAPLPFINEIHYDDAGADAGEGVEIAGLAGLDLTGMSLVPYNGSNGQTYSITALSGIIPNQQNSFGTLFFPISGLQNGVTDGVALVAADGTTVLQFLSYEGSFVATNGPASGMMSEDIGVAEFGSTLDGDSLQLAGSGFEYADFTWQDAMASTYGMVNTNQSFGAAGDTGNNGGETGGDVVLGQCADPATLISAVQGNGAMSPLVGETHVLEAVVSASFANLSGFFIQEQTADMDADIQTSEGIFVYYSGELPTAGTVVRVLGKVEEYFDKTQLNVTTAPLDCGVDSVTATSLSLPFADAEFPESLEGMLVSTSSELTVTDNYSLGRYGEVALSNGRLFVPTNIYPAGSEEAIALAAQNALNKITLDDGMNGSNPDPVIYPTGNLSANNTLRGGDIVSSLTGVMDFSFNLYRIIPTEAPTFVANNPRTAAPELTLGNLKVASLNVLNLFNGDGQGAGFPTSRGALTAAEFERQLTKTVAALAAMDADIVGLMEIENDGFDSTSAIAELTSRLNAVVGTGVYTFVDGGGAIGTDEIKVAMLYKPSKVSPVGGYKVLTSSNSITDEQGPLFVDTKNRPSFNQKFALIENAQEIVVSVNHLKSKGSTCGVGDDDTSTGQGNCNLTRTRAAEALTAFLAQEYPDSPTLIIGDLNAYAQEDPILKIKEAGYTDLANFFKGADAYSYAFGGEYGYLDHALANQALLDKVVDTTEWHINADEPTVLDYNFGSKSEQQISDFYAPDAYRMSDHDPVVIAIELKAAAVKGDWDGDGDVDINDVRGLISAIQARQTIDMAFDLNNDGVVNILDARVMMTLCTRTRCAA